MPPPIHAIRFPFAIDAGRGRLAEEPDYAEHVDQLIRQVLLTAPGERINRPDFGCGLGRMVFAPNGEETAGLTRIIVLQALERWLGGVIQVERVTVQASPEGLEVGIHYRLRVRQQRRFLNLEVGP